MGLPSPLPSRGGKRKHSGPGWVPSMHLTYAQIPDVSVFLIYKDTPFAQPLVTGKQ